MATRAPVDRCSTGHGDPPLLQVGTKHDAPRGQKTVTSAGGSRPAPVLEVAGPQRAAATIGCVAAAVPLLTTLVLGVADNLLDAKTPFCLRLRWRTIGWKG